MFSGEVAVGGIEIKACRDRSYDNLHVDHVLCDTSRLTQILINLISNAIKFTSSRLERRISVSYGAQSTLPPRITTAFGDLQWVPQRDLNRLNTALPALEATEEPFYLYFCVRDTGPGLLPAEIERLFKRFSQASSRTHISYGGSGLGLYISKELAEKQGGQVGVASRRGEGAVFGFYIETRKAKAAETEHERSPTQPTQPAIKRSDLHRQPSTSAGLAKTGSSAPDQAHRGTPQADLIHPLPHPSQCSRAPSSTTLFACSPAKLPLAASRSKLAETAPMTACTSTMCSAIHPDSRKSSSI